MANILFGLHRLQRIAYGPFSKKVISREAFVYHSDVISGARQSHQGDFWLKKRSSQVSEVDLSKRPPQLTGNQVRLTGNQARLKSSRTEKLSNRLVI